MTDRSTTWMSRLAKRSQGARLATFRLLERALSPRLDPTQFSPEIDVLGDSLEVITALLAKDLERHGGRTPTYLDVGGRKGERANVARGYQYLAMDLEPRAEHVVVGDICQARRSPTTRTTSWPRTTCSSTCSDRGTRRASASASPSRAAC